MSGLVWRSNDARGAGFDCASGGAGGTPEASGWSTSSDDGIRSPGGVILSERSESKDLRRARRDAPALRPQP
ncbi:MAG: hypothetical protein AAFQ43_07545, partial [Bacteroidota bacterium]